MSETTSTPAPADKTAANSLCRLRTLTYVSLALNALIILLIIIGIICHHHRRHQGFAGGFGRGGHGAYSSMRGGFGGPGQRFHRFGGGFGGQGPGNFRAGPGGFGGPGGPGGPGNFQRGPGPGGPGGFGGPGGPGGFALFVRGNGNGNPPDPAKMTDAVLNQLTQRLTLTDDQKAKIKPIIAQQVAELQKQMEAQRTALQKQIEDAKAQIKPLLTPDQQKQLDALPIPGQKPPDASAAPSN